MKTNTTCPVCGEILPSGLSKCTHCGYEIHYYTLPLHPAILSYEDLRASEYKQSFHEKVSSHKDVSSFNGNLFMRVLHSIGNYLIRLSS